jgi:hypothetical protein
MRTNAPLYRTYLIKEQLREVFGLRRGWTPVAGRSDRLMRPLPAARTRGPRPDPGPLPGADLGDARSEATKRTCGY